MHLMNRLIRFRSELARPCAVGSCSCPSNFQLLESGDFECLNSTLVNIMWSIYMLFVCGNGIT